MYIAIDSEATHIFVYFKIWVQIDVDDDDIDVLTTQILS